MLSQRNYRECQADGWSNDIPHCEGKWSLTLNSLLNCLFICLILSKIVCDCFISINLPMFEVKLGSREALTVTSQPFYSLPLFSFC